MIIKNRVKFIKETYQPAKILDIYESQEFTEVIFKEGGDVITLRVYGNEAKGYTVVER